MMRRNAWTFRLLLISLALLLCMLALQPLLRIAVLRNSHHLVGLPWTIDRFESSLRRGKLAMENVKALGDERSKSTHFEAKQIVLDLNWRALAGGQILIPRAFVNGLNLQLPAISPNSVSDTQDANRGKSELEKDLLAWLSLAKQELDSATSARFTSVKLAQDVILRWGTSLEDTELRAVAARDQRRELLHAIDRVGENPLRNSAFYQETIEAIDRLESEVFEIRGEVNRWRQQADMDRDAIRKAVDEDLASAVQPIAMPDARKVTNYLLEPDVAQRIQTIVTWLAWGRQFLPTYYHHRSEAVSTGRGQRIVFDGLTARPDLLIESMALRGCGASSDGKFQIEGAISHLSSHPSRNEFPTEIVLNTLGQSQTILHVTLDARHGQLSEQISVTSPRCAIAERKLGRPDLLALTVSAGIGHYSVTIEQRDGRLDGSLKLQQPGVVLAPCFTHLLDSPQVAALVTDAIREIETLEVEARISGTWEHPQWVLRSNLGTELAEKLAQQLYSRRLAVHRAELDRAMVALEAQLNVRYELCSNRCHRIAANLESEDGELRQLRATVASRSDAAKTR